MLDGYEIAERVRTRRKRLGLTQAELGLRAGTSVQTIVRIEKGEAASVSSGTTANVLNALGFSIYIELGAEDPQTVLDETAVENYLQEKYFGGRSSSS